MDAADIALRSVRSRNASTETDHGILTSLCESYDLQRGREAAERAALQGQTTYENTATAQAGCAISQPDKCRHGGLEADAIDEIRGSDEHTRTANDHDITANSCG